MILVELIVATILIGILMLGIMAIELAMRQTFSTTFKSAALSMKVSAAMLHFSRNISKAIGHRGVPGVDEGIAKVDDAVCTKLYVRQDNLGTPADYTDDTWVRYQHDTGANSSLMFCDNSPDPTINIACDATACNGNYYELLKVYSLAYDIIKDDVNLQYYTEVNLTAYYDNTNPLIGSIKNPKIEDMQTKISYMSHSW